MPDTFRLVRAPVHEQVRDYLHRQIRSGRITPGSALPSERELAQRLGVSRHSLRQAIASLEAVGIVETRHGSGVYLTRHPSDAAVSRVADALFTEATTISEAIEARLALEPTVARLAAERADAEGIATLRASVAEAPTGAGAVADSVGEAQDFHRHLAQLTGNPIFEGLLRSVTAGPHNAARLARHHPDAPRRWHADHVAITAAIAAGDGRKAARLMTSHLESVAELARAVDAEGVTTASG